MGRGQPSRPHQHNPKVHLQIAEDATADPPFKHTQRRGGPLAAVLARDGERILSILADLRRAAADLRIFVAGVVLVA